MLNNAQAVNRKNIYPMYLKKILLSSGSRTLLKNNTDANIIINGIKNAAIPNIKYKVSLK